MSRRTSSKLPDEYPGSGPAVDTRGRPRRLNDRPVKWRRHMPYILLTPASVIAALLAWLMPSVVEAVYSGAVYPVVHAVIGLPARWLPFSLAEALLLVLFCFVLWKLATAGARVVNHTRSLRNTLKHLCARGLAWLGVLSASFLLVWGFNYHRQPLAHSFGLESSLAGSPPTPAELEELCKELVAAANRLRVTAAAGHGGPLELSDGTGGTLARAHKGYDVIDELLPAGASSGAPPKPVLLSTVMAWVGISGIYFPFTGEANVNTTLPGASVPFTACHELAHQRGFAREDEANYLGYLACAAHPDADFQYSGTLAAMRYSLGALAQADIEAYARIVGRRASEGAPIEGSTISAGVWSDLEASKQWRELYRSPASAVSVGVNSAYLKLNAQSGGVKSYGRMVDLLVAAQRRGGPFRPQ